MGGENFQSRLASSKAEAFDVAVQLIFGEMPDHKTEPELFDEFVVFNSDFQNEKLWGENGNLFETDVKESDYIVIVKVQSDLN